MVGQERSKPSPQCRTSQSLVRLDQQRPESFPQFHRKPARSAAIESGGFRCSREIQPPLQQLFFCPGRAVIMWQGNFGTDVLSAARFAIRSNLFKQLPDNGRRGESDCRSVQAVHILDDGRTLELQKLVGDVYMIPPIIVFIDGIPALPKKVEQGMAKAVSGKFITENGFAFNTTHVCWLVSTTDADLLPDPFDKFTAIHLKALGKKGIARVVAIHNPDWEAEVCNLVAQHADSPGEALAFAKEMRVEFEMSGGDWDEVVETVVKDSGSQKSSPWINRLRSSRN